MTNNNTNSKFYAIRKHLVESKSLFVDEEFPPDIKSVTGIGPLTRNIPVRRIEWRRPIDIVRNPKFVSVSATRSDLDQGLLGNCWYVAAASLLVNGPKKQFERVVPLDQGFDPSGYAGIFHFNFWWYGKWKEIIIDDYLPTDGQRLIFCQNEGQRDEFWGALMEKAYAKLRGSYMALDGGKLSDALVDFTGGLGERVNLQIRQEIPNNLYDLLWKGSQMNSMLGGSIYLPEGATRPEVRRSNGLYMGHAYSITALSVVPWHGSSVRLLRLRNPWGRKEWEGPWSDDSYEIRNLPMELKRKLNIVVEDEGEFWMSFEDFVDNFDEVQMCHLQPDAIHQELAISKNKQNWSVTVYHDAWIKGVTAGGCGNPPYQELFWKNPQFQIHLKDPDSTDNVNKCTMIVSLMEKEKDNDLNKIAIGYDVFEIRDPRRRPLDGEALPRGALIQRARSGKYQFYREVMTRFELKPGYYVVIPSTFDPHQESEFLLRIFTEKEVESEVMDENNSPTVKKKRRRDVKDAEKLISFSVIGAEHTDHIRDILQPAVPSEDAISVLFQKYAGEDGKMDFKELKNFLLEATGKELKQPIAFNREACRSLVTLMDMNKSGYLSIEQALKVFDQVRVYLRDKTGYLSTEEAKAVYKEVKNYMSVFKKFDKDQSNSVDTIELGTMFNTLGFPVSRMVLTSIVRRYGSRARKINLEDFIIVMCKLVAMFHVFQTQHEKTGGPDDVAQFTRNEFLQYTMFC